MPVQATAASYENLDVRPGAFVGARIHLSLGGKSAARPQAALTVAPTRSHISDGAILSTEIANGLALNIGSKPSLTIAGIRADRALGLAPSKSVDASRKLGLSKGGWVAIGVGVVVVAAAIYGLSVYDEAKDNSD
jgi:hypothetical protein